MKKPVQFGQKESRTGLETTKIEDFYRSQLDHFNSSCSIEVMNRDNATKVFESLSSGVRLDAWRLLVKAGSKGLVAGEMATEMGVAPNSLSFHLKAMFHAGLVTVTKEGRFQRYRADIPLMLDLIAYMTEACCEDENNATCSPPSSSSICPSCDQTLTQEPSSE
ncbi:ArsR/SmtB family transcription factor [Photobacterium sanguinicancri]|uniref:ArsR/SmtB family transcription factor n=1 Tax=Photobacterium sanguinicancri TaxID=875932 RepID=UPI000ABF2624|nr:helix-turn-helix domain-containing protein [Photobacterium sanguinicancri]